MSLTLPSAYLLVSHGSRDPRPQAATAKLAQLLAEKVQNFSSEVPSDRCANSPVYSGVSASSACLLTPQIAASKSPLLVDTACLELAALPLHEQIQQFGDRVLAAGCNRMQVLPLFLLPGVHVMEDIPAEVAIAQTDLGRDVIIAIQPHLGTHAGLKELLANHMTSVAAEAWILLSHGSRRPGGNQPVQAIAAQLGAVPAYWSVAPSLESQLTNLVRSGHQQIGILPYFLFAGGITDAIAAVVEQLSQQFPTVNLNLAEPLGASAELANLVLDLTLA